MANIFNTKTISEEKLILAEGDDDCYFLLNLLSKTEMNGIQISDIEGVNKLTNHIEAIKRMDGWI